MIDLYILVEGQTEQAFANQVLKDHLAGFGVNLCGSIRTITKTTRIQSFRGGIPPFPIIQRQIHNLLFQHRRPNVRFTTMLDLAGLPSNYPGFQDVRNESDPYRKVKILEDALQLDINDSRFISYFQLHEFEALIFVQLEAIIHSFPGRQNEIEQLKASVHENNPELINGQNPPSRWIGQFIPEYRAAKSTYGPQITRRIGLNQLRSNARHFNEWLTRLEIMNSTPPSS